MPYYHATYADRLASIQKHGLGAVPAPQNFEGCEPGIYLAGCPMIAMSFLVEHSLETADETVSPCEAVESFRIIVIDDSRIDARRLRHDPQVDRKDLDLWLYDRSIDVTGLVVINADTVLANAVAPTGA